MNVAWRRRRRSKSAAPRRSATAGTATAAALRLSTRRIATALASERWNASAFDAHHTNKMAAEVLITGSGCCHAAVARRHLLKETKLGRRDSYFWCSETPSVKPAPLGTRGGGTATFPTKAPAFAPSCRVSKTCGAWPRFPNPAPRWFFYGGESVGLFFVVLLSWNTRVKREKLFRKNVHYGPTFYTNPALGVGGGGPVLHCHRLAWAGSPAPSRDGEVG